jgi:Na+/H+-dicarboxylate symporter
MEEKKGLGLLPKLIIGIVLGIIIGIVVPKSLMRIITTFTSLFGNYLNFVVPLIIIGFVVPGIADIGKGAGKLVGFTVFLSYASTVIWAIFAYFVSIGLFPKIIDFSKYAASGNFEEKILEPLFVIEMPPLYNITSAILLSFILGIGISAVKNKTMLDFFNGFQGIVNRLLETTIIPALPCYIAGIFAELAYSGQIVEILSVYGRVFVAVLIVQVIVILLEYLIASIYSGRRITVKELIKNVIPAYLTGIGTQSSAATIPVNLETAKANGVAKEIRDFLIPLTATIHFAGSSIAITMFAISVMMMDSLPISFGTIVGFIMLMGVTMVAAPGIPGGAVMAALGLLQGMLGFNEAQLALMIALYISQDSFGTATSVAGNNAVAVIVDTRARRLQK